MKLTQNMVEGWRNSICLSPGKGTEPRDRHDNCVSIDIPNVVLALDPGLTRARKPCTAELHPQSLHILCLQSLHLMRHFYTKCAVWLPLVKEHVPADARSDFLKMLEMRKLRLLCKSCDFKILAFFKISYRASSKMPQLQAISGSLANWLNTAHLKCYGVFLTWWRELLKTHSGSQTKFCPSCPQPIATMAGRNFFSSGP